MPLKEILTAIIIRTCNRQQSESRSDERCPRLCHSYSCPLQTLRDWRRPVRILVSPILLPALFPRLRPSVPPSMAAVHLHSRPPQPSPSQSITIEQYPRRQHENPSRRPPHAFQRTTIARDAGVTHKLHDEERAGTLVKNLYTVV